MRESKRKARSIHWTRVRMRREEKKTPSCNEQWSIRIVYSAVCDNFISFVKNEQRTYIEYFGEWFCIRRRLWHSFQFCFFFSLLALCFVFRAQLQLRTNHGSGIKTGTPICLRWNAEIRLKQIELFSRRTCNDTSFIRYETCLQTRTYENRNRDVINWPADKEKKD